MKIVFQMDAPESLKFASDTTIALGIEAIKRGYQTFYYLPSELSLDSAKPKAPIKSIKFFDNPEKFFETSASASSPYLDDYDVIMVRQDPPYDMHYLTTCHILKFVNKKTKVINSPDALINLPEKFSPFSFPEFMPPTLISSDYSLIEDFSKQHGEVVLKPLYLFGGKGIFKTNHSEANFRSILDILLETGGGAIVAQKFLPEVSEAEKRIFIINGEVIGGFQRRPKAGSIISNMAAGGTPEATTLTSRELEVANHIASFLKKNDVLIAGIDLIGGYLNEINITSPTGFRAYQKIYEINLAAKTLDCI